MRYARIAATPEQIEPYLPGNYRVVEVDDDGYATDIPAVIIGGEDVAGWTLDEYVLPRLASGLYFGEEIDGNGYGEV